MTLKGIDRRRARLWFAAVGMGGQPDPALFGGDASIDATAQAVRDDHAFWSDFVGFASAHTLVPALAERFMHAPLRSAAPGGLVDYVGAMWDSNAKRNALLCRGLEQVSYLLNDIGLLPVVGKGGVFLALADAPVQSRSLAKTLDQAMGPAAWRFLSDLDFYVEPDELYPALDALFAAGYLPVSDQYEPERMAHYPALLSPCGRYQVELHTRLFAFTGNFARVEDLRASGDVCRVGEGSLVTPSLPDRMAHLIAHAQLHNGLYARRRLFLRDLMDFAVLSDEDMSIDWRDAMRERFVDRDERDAIDGFLGAVCLMLGDRVARPFESALPEEAMAWGRTTVQRMTLRASVQKARHAVDLAKHEMVSTLRRGDGVARVTAALSSPSRLIAWFTDARRKSGSVR